MFRFSDPQYLYLLFVIPVLFGYFIFLNHREKKYLKTMGNPETIARLMPDVSRSRKWWHFYLQIAAMIVCIFMISGPQFGSKLEKVKRKGVDLMVALDVSNSMMAQDIVPSRLEKAKLTLSRLMDKLVDDKVGLIVFAGEAYTQLPITADYVSAKMFLGNISTKLVPTQGTAIGSAIQLAIRSFSLDDKADKAIIIITDGENHEDDAVAAAKLACDKGIKVHVVGMGSAKGAPIPAGGGNNYLKDKDGNIVVTKLNEEMCRQIAKAGEGIYVRSGNSNVALKALSEELDKMTKADIESKVYSEYDEQFQSLAWIVLALLFIDMFILERKNPHLKNIKLF